MSLSKKLEVDSHKKNEFSRDLVIQEERLKALKARALSFYDNFEQEFAEFELNFTSSFGQILQLLAKSKLEF